MIKVVLKLFLLAVSFQLGLAQTNFDIDKLNHYFDELERSNKFMGSVAISEKGKIIYSRTIGFVDVENKLKANENSKYRIGSISKTFTAVLVLKAVEEQRLDLSQTIQEWFPSLKNAEKITVENLLSHRSGIHNFTDDKSYLTWNTKPKTEKEMLDIITKGGVDFEPGTKSKYSNSNYVLLTYILEKIYGEPYSDLLQKYITRPIGLVNTSIFSPINPVNNECKSYSFVENWKEESETDVTIPLGAGAIASTAKDLTKFVDALFTGKLLRKNSLLKMKKVDGKYGLGLFQIPFYEYKGYGHTGGIDGFSSVFSYFPDRKITYVQVSNGTNYNNNNISIAVLSAVYNKPYEIPSFTSYTPSIDELDNCIGVYSSIAIPIKITITREGSVLKGQGTGQPSFPLEAIEKNKFKFDKAGLEMKFNHVEKTMIMTQGGKMFRFTKE
ncbi:beta-lactamase family protein [Riemerella anatipestifer]|uniref:serine hydrolase domain-containing protein n=1 Tax=Riemerella anatipestifer TaxID=34085 RepID=UPI0030BBE1FB